MAEVRLISGAEKVDVAPPTDPRPRPKMRLTLDFLRCPLGRVKLVQVVLNALLSVYVNFMSGSSEMGYRRDDNWSLWHFGLVFSICGKMSGLHLAAVASNLPQVYKETPWRRIELVYCWGAVVLLLLSSNFALNLIYPQMAKDIAFSVIAVGDILLYLYNILLLHEPERPSPTVPGHSGLVDFT